MTDIEPLILLSWCAIGLLIVSLSPGIRRLNNVRRFDPEDYVGLVLLWPYALWMCWKLRDLDEDLDLDEDEDE